jgi:metallo-beta-lactamase family protein
MKIKFCGAAKEVTGSTHLLILENGRKILLDCGLYQGHEPEFENFNDNWGFIPSELDFMILSHAHIDHCGRLPKLVKDGFSGKIYCTHATKALAVIMLTDSAKIQEMDAVFEQKRLEKRKRNKSFRDNEQPTQKVEPLYREEDVIKLIPQLTEVPYDNWFQIDEEVNLLLRDAGHILGSANVSLAIKESGKTINVGFSGDIGRPNRPILRDPIPMPEMDFVISESTYGNRDHESAPNEELKLLEIIKEVCVENRGKLIIPAFSLGRTQELVYIMDRLSSEGRLPRIPVYVDSPLSINATTVFMAHPECFDEDLHNYMLTDSNPFGFNGLRYIRKAEESKQLNEFIGPCVIISASGMGNAGRIRHHLFNNISNPRNGVLIVGYCAPQTPGGIIRSGADSLKLFGERLPIHAKVFVMDSFSAHGDRNEMFDFLKNQIDSAKNLFLVHGQIDAQESFRTMLLNAGFSKVTIPNLMEEHEL